ncbi:MAG: GNAT family N-acetyltransferase [Bdellovibrionota bacterium]
MNLQPTLKGNLTTLRPLKSDEFESLFAVSADPLLWEQHPVYDRYKREVFEDFFKLAIESQGAFAIIDNSSGEMIGSSRFYDLDPTKKTVIVGYTFLARKYWGKRYNEEIKNLMLNYAFQFVDTVLFEVGENNMRSQLAMKKIGAKLAGKTNLDNKSRLIFKIDKKDWKDV